MGIEIDNEKSKFLYYPLVADENQLGSTIEKVTKLNQYIYLLKNRSMDITVLNIDNNQCIIMESNASNCNFYCYDIKNKKECCSEVKLDGKDDNLFRYCEEYYDKETKEVYLRARYYQPTVGRFLTRGTYTGEDNEPLSMHLYTYCENDGVNAWDSSGHYSEKIKVKNKRIKTSCRKTEE